MTQEGFMQHRILVVEDQGDIRKMMAIYLKMHKYDVVEARDGYDAVEKAIANRPDVVLMDMAMPVLDGLGAVRAMRSHDTLADVPIVGITAYGDFYQQRARDAGCDEVIQKPIDFSRLDELLHRHMDRVH
jgi:two-component system cell cycle response regulator DivK